MSCIAPNLQLTHCLFIQSIGIWWPFYVCIHWNWVAACILEAIFKRQQHPLHGFTVGYVRADQNKTVRLDAREIFFCHHWVLSSILREKKCVVGTEKKPERCLVRVELLLAGRPAHVCASLTAHFSLGGPLLVPCPETIFSLPVCGWKRTAPGKLVCRLRAACAPSPGCIHGAALLGGKLQLWELLSCCRCLILNHFGNGCFTACFWYFSHHVPDYWLPYEQGGKHLLYEKLLLGHCGPIL